MIQVEVYTCDCRIVVQETRYNILGLRQNNTQKSHKCPRLLETRLSSVCPSKSRAKLSLFDAKIQCKCMIAFVHKSQTCPFVWTFIGAENSLFCHQDFLLIIRKIGRYTTVIFGFISNIDKDDVASQEVKAIILLPYCFTAGVKLIVSKM